MNNSVFPDWEKIVRDNKEIFLNSIIDRYGEENRELLSKRYDETKVCFFETPARLTDYIDIHAKKELILETIEFLKGIGIDTSSIYENEDGLTSNDPDIEKKLECLFGTKKRLSLDYTPSTILGLSDKTSVFINLQMRISNFLKMYNMHDYEIYQNNPEEIKTKYLTLSSIAQNHLQMGINKYNDLMRYVVYLKARERSATEKYSYNIGRGLNTKDLTSYELDVYVLNNFDFQDIPLNLRNEFLSVMRQNNTNFAHGNLVFLCPYCLKSYSFDNIYDHEFTHALESFSYTLPNGYKVRKCGIEEITYDSFSKIIKIKNKNTNEAITQLLAVESTHKRYSNKQIIFEDPKEDVNKIGVSSCSYDKNLSKARALVDALPSDFIKRRIESTIEFIYEYFDEKTWDEIDSKIDDNNVSLEEFTNYINEKRGVSL